MLAADISTVFYPSYSILADNTGRRVSGWGICDNVDDKKVWVCADDTRRPLLFGRKRDCEVAIENLARHGVTTVEAMERLSDDEYVRLCCECLAF